MTGEQIKAIYDLGLEAVIDLVKSLFGLIEEQQRELGRLKERVKELEDRLAINSRNSSQPPSSDRFVKKTQSLRQPSGKKSGGQQGHPGRTLSCVETPDQVMVHQPPQCSSCGGPLSDAGSTLTPERRQVFDLPPLKLWVTEHRVAIKECRQCHQPTVGAFPESVPSGASYGVGVRSLMLYLNKQHFIPSWRTGEIVEDLFDQPVSEGTLQSAVEQCAEALAEIEEVIKRAIVQAPVGHFDETGMYVEGRRGWLHSASTEQLTHYGYHQRRGSVATDEIGILPQFTGRACHDGWSAYLTYPCQHALCNAHHLRELTFLDEQQQKPWAGQMKALLLEIKQQVDQAKEQGHRQLSSETQAAFSGRYDQIVSRGLEAEANEPAPVSGHRGRKKQSKAKNLLLRLSRYKEETLCFMKEFAVPFDNNLAERDLRMMKVQQKVSGCFRTTHGAKEFCRIRSYLSTMKKQGHNLLDALNSVFAGTPLVPASPG
jgi:transposase